MSTNDIIEIYKGKSFFTQSRKRTTSVLAFDLDETLGSFVDLEVLWRWINSMKNNNISFNQVLDLYPEFLRFGILHILEYLIQKKKQGLCDKIYIYTNNQCESNLVELISKYFNYKLKTDGDIFDRTICAFKINGKNVELSRTTHKKTYSDFIKCTLLPKKTKICFIDNTYYPDMLNNRVYYIQPISYFHNMVTTNIIDRFLSSNLFDKLKSDNDNIIMKNDLIQTFSKYYNNYTIPNKMNIDILVAQKIMYHIKEFFYFSNRKIRTKKIKGQVGHFTRKNRKGGVQ